MIDRFALNGRDLGSYDHGVTGRAAQGLPPVPWTSQQPIDVSSPQFDSTQPATWNYAAPERRVFGLAVHQGRLYYAVADSLQIWSVGLKPDGAFGDDAMIELACRHRPARPKSRKSRSTSRGGCFLLTGRRRPAHSTSRPWPFRRSAACCATRSSERRRRAGASGSNSPTNMPSAFRPISATAMAASPSATITTKAARLSPGSCGGFMWTTGEELRHAADAALAARLGRTGALDVNGLQGNGTWRIRPNNEPPLESYFIDYDDEFYDAAARGHMGDIAIERLCSPRPAREASCRRRAARTMLAPVRRGAGQPPATQPPPPPPPPGQCLPGQLRPRGQRMSASSCPPPGVQIGGRCCSVTQIAATAVCSNSSCPPGQTPIGPSNFCCPAVRSMPARAARRRAAAGRSSTASACREAAEVSAGRKRGEPSAPTAMCRPAAPVASPAR